MAEAHQLDPAGVVEAVIDGLRQGIEFTGIQAKLDAYGPDVPFEAAMLFDLSFTEITCKLDWVERFIKRLDSKQFKP